MSNGTFKLGAADPPHRAQQENEDQMETVLPSIEPWVESEGDAKSLQYCMEWLRLVEEQSTNYVSPPYSDCVDTQQGGASSQEMVQTPVEESSLAMHDTAPRNPSRDPGYSCIRSTGTSEWSQAVQERRRVREEQNNTSSKSTTGSPQRAVGSCTEQEIDLEELPCSARERSARSERRLWQQQSEPWLYNPGVYIRQSEDGKLIVRLSKPILKRE